MSTTSMDDDGGWMDVEDAAPVDSAWLGTLFPTKDAAKREQWLAVLHANEFDAQADLASLDAASWESLPLPLAIKAAMRQALATPAPTIEEDVPPPCSGGSAVVAITPPVAAPPPPVTQCDIIVIDISASMRSLSSLDPDEGEANADYDPTARETTTSTRRTREDMSKILFHTMVDKTLVFELSHAVGLLAFGTEVLPHAITRDYESFHDELGRLDANQCGTRLYDAIVTAGDMLQAYCAQEGLGEDVRKRVFVLTDGDDNRSSTQPWAAAEHLQAAGITLDAIPLAGMNATLAALCAATGGLCFDVDSQEQGIGLFEREATLQLCSREEDHDDAAASGGSGVSPPPPPRPRGKQVTDAASFNALVRSINAKPSASATVTRQVKSVVPKKVFAPVMTAQAAAALASKAAAAAAPSGGGGGGGGGANLRRALKEYGGLISDPLENWRVFVSAENPMQWKAVFERGQPSDEWLQTQGSCPYAGGTWLLTIDLPTDYPFAAPRIRFVTPVYHCNVSVDGMICMQLLQDAWSPAVTMRRALEGVQALLMSPDAMNPLDAFKGQLYRDDLPRYQAEATKHTLDHAREGFDVLAQRFNLTAAAEKAAAAAS
jgi:ubiquitin-protein ligase